jgi:hypothetical protein
MATKVWISTSSTAFTTAANWSTNSAPANSDVLIFNSLGTANVAGVSTSLTGVTLVVEDTYAGTIGSIPTGQTAASYLVLDGGSLVVGQSSGGTSGGGASQVLVNFGSTAATVTSYNTSSSSASAYYPAVCLSGTALTINLYGGNVGVAAFPGETATASAINIVGGNRTSPSLQLGAGATTTAITVKDGTVYNYSDQTQTAVTLSENGTYYSYGVAPHTTLTVGARATANYLGSGAITTLNVSGKFDRSMSSKALTLTTTNLYAGSEFYLDNGKASSTTRTTVNLVQCGMSHIRVSTPIGEKL